MTYLRLLVVGLFLGTVVAGCDRKEKLLEIDTPEGGIEIERDKQTGEIDVDVNE